MHEHTVAIRASRARILSTTIVIGMILDASLRTLTALALAVTRGHALDTRGYRNPMPDPVSDLRPYDAKSDS